jgi:hypothetical protein
MEPTRFLTATQATRAFYEANGFILARDFPEYWKSDTPVLMVRPLNDMKAWSGRRVASRRT